MKLFPKILPLLPDNKSEFVKLFDLVVTRHWQHSKSFMEICVASFTSTHYSSRSDLIDLLTSVLSNDKTNITNWLSNYKNSITDIAEKHHATLIHSSQSILANTSPETVLDFIKSAPFVSQRIDLNKMDQWISSGLEIYSNNEIAGIEFFKTHSSKSIDLINELSSVVDLEQEKDKLELYCIALTGNQIELASREEISSKNIGWAISELSTTEGETIYLPSQSNKYATKQENNSWYKVIATHQTGHIEFGSFKFSFANRPIHFVDIRKKFLAEIEAKNKSSDNNANKFLTDIQQFFNLFPNKDLALDIFTVIEGGRIDNTVKHDYPGIKTQYEKIQLESLELRPNLESLPTKKC